MVNRLRKGWRYSTLLHLLDSVRPSLQHTIDVYNERGVVPRCTLPKFQLTPELFHAWALNGLSYLEIILHRPTLAAEIEERAWAFQCKEDERRFQEVVPSPTIPSCDVCGCRAEATRSTCRVCTRHASSTQRHERTLMSLARAQEQGGVLGLTAVAQPPRELPVVPTPVAEPAFLNRTEQLCLGIGPTDDINLPHVEPEPYGYRVGDFTSNSTNCGSEMFIRNIELCRACDRYLKKNGTDCPEELNGTDCPEELHAIHSETCRVCGEQKRLASRHLPCLDCYRNERSFYDRNAPKVCTGCGTGEKKVRRPAGSCLVSHPLSQMCSEPDGVQLTDSTAIRTIISSTTPGAPSSACRKNLTSNPARCANVERPSPTRRSILAWSGECTTLAPDTKRARAFPGRCSSFAGAVTDCANCGVEIKRGVFGCWNGYIAKYLVGNPAICRPCGECERHSKCTRPLHIINRWMRKQGLPELAASPVCTFGPTAMTPLTYASAWFPTSPSLSLPVAATTSATKRIGDATSSAPPKRQITSEEGTNDAHPRRRVPLRRKSRGNAASHPCTSTRTFAHGAAPTARVASSRSPVSQRYHALRELWRDHDLASQVPEYVH